MADPYNTPKTGPGVSGVDPYGTAPRTDVPPTRVHVNNGGGFSAGMLVAIVFIVVAIIAAALYSNRDYFSPAPVDNNVTIENNTPAASPAADSPDAGTSVAPASNGTAETGAPATGTETAPAAETTAPATGTGTGTAPAPAAPANP